MGGLKGWLAGLPLRDRMIYLLLLVLLGFILTVYAVVGLGMVFDIPLPPLNAPSAIAPLAPSETIHPSPEASTTLVATPTEEPSATPRPSPRVTATPTATVTAASTSTILPTIEAISATPEPPLPTRRPTQPPPPPPPTNTPS
ncbi:MAG: hypothetical protein HGA45_10245, partial [Chloroflexales bacterium]|nr:hypothetical protein [Chloroflexales bacterium]